MPTDYLDVPESFRTDDNYTADPKPDNQRGWLPTRPADLIAAITGGDADEIQLQTEAAVEGTATGTPPPIGPGAPGAPASVSRLAQALGIGGSFAVANTQTDRDVADDLNTAAGGATPDYDSTPGPDDEGIPWRQLGLFAGGFVLLVVVANALASGAAEGLTG